MEFVLELGLSALRAGSDRFSVVAVECAGGLGVVAVKCQILCRAFAKCTRETYRLGPSSS